MTDITDWLERGDASYKLREDGRVDVFSPHGFQILNFSQVPAAVLEELTKQSEGKA
jgi:hypothetical protein